MPMPRITFVTTSRGTKWESYSQALLEINFPEFNRLIIDGRRDWTPLGFLTEALKYQSDYIIHVDEDCFVTDRKLVLDWLDIMEQSHEFAVLGTPDGGTFHRDYNPVACNLFFTIFRTSALRVTLSNPDWMGSKFKDEYMQKINILEQLDESRISWVKEEPYYPLLWALLNQDYIFHYIVPGMNSNLLASEIRNATGEVALIHMWWLRFWDKNEIEPYLEVAHNERYKKLKDYLVLYYFNTFKNRYLLLKNNIRRRIRLLVG